MFKYLDFFYYNLQEIAEFLELNNCPYELNNWFADDSLGF